MRRIALVAAVLAGCARVPAPSSPGALVWRACGEAFECAELPVPLDHERPAGARLSLALLRRPAAKPAERIGVLVVNPGGPGISAIGHLRGSASHYGVLGERFDLVAFDTRGTGASAPLDCHESVDAHLAQDPTPTTDAEWAGVVAASRAVAEECARKHGDLLPFAGTGESARDMDLIRAALGEERLSYLGFSYGTALGATYAALFPGRVRAMVLDGAIEPSFDLVVFAREQAVAVEGALAGYEAEALRAGWHGTDVLDAVTARAESAPIPSAGNVRAARASDILYGTVEAVIAPGEGWHALASALGAAQSGDGAPFVRLSDRYFQRDGDGRSELRVEAQLAVLCADLHRPASVQAYRDAIPELARASPHVGVANLMSLLPCAFWPAPARPLPALRAVAGLPILVIAGSHDPLTPGAWGVRLSEALGPSARLDVESDLHTAYGRDGECANQIVDRFFLSLERPASPRACASASTRS